MPNALSLLFMYPLITYLVLLLTCFNFAVIKDILTVFIKTLTKGAQLQILAQIILFETSHAINMVFVFSLVDNEVESAFFG